MATGRVKWFNEQKGYGFIEQDGGQELFVHHTGISGEGFRNLYENQTVEFDVEQGQKGPKAVNVKTV
ncbi:MAG: cold-shock protein [Candidatus Hinthialibacter sp.]